ncbi:MAG: transpeptidase family protein [Deltaproteobacteria bacterium]|jgi:cell division protein FtsI (penicillin-binding protein 3)|nr:transpeptidase family protein [Deltaproteobacteria bacterium]
MYQLPQSAAGRLYILLGFFFFCFVAIVTQAFRLQIINAEFLQAKAARSTERNYTAAHFRGNIIDRNGERLATTVATESVFVDRSKVLDLGDATYALWRVLNLDYEKVSAALEKIPDSSQFAFLKRHISPEESKALKKIDFDGLGIKKEYRRDYPNGELAAHLLGFVGYDGQGLEGLEKSLDHMLMVQPEKTKVKRDGRGRRIITEPEQAIDSSQGASVMLSLDLRIQNIAEKTLKKAVEERSAKSGLVVAVKPSTGEILAMAIYPGYDPNNYALTSENERRNLALTDPFEPGSTFKIFTVSAALEENLIAPETIFYCENGTYQIDSFNIIRDTGRYGNLMVKEIVKKSSNIGATKIAERLGAKRFHNYLLKFGFGQKTGLSYPSGESAGILRSPERWMVVDAANIAFGQGLSVTALQMAMAVSALANDGVLMKPSLVARVVDSQGRVKEHLPPRIARQVVSPLTARQVMAMMRMAVLKGGTGWRADIKEYPVAGKTGTSQKWIPGRGYNTDKFIASFVGIAPYDNPQICVLVVLDEPWPSHSGGEVAAPVFREIVSQALPLMDIPPTDDPSEPKWPTRHRPLPGAPGVLTAGAERSIRSFNFIKGAIDKKGRGPVPQFKVEAGRFELEKEKPKKNQAKKLTAERLTEAAQEDPLLQAAMAPEIMPQVTGLTMREVLDLLAVYNLDLELEGSGVAVSQEPKGGERVKSGGLARVVFRH